jgi:hypothetical protein
MDNKKTFIEQQINEYLELEVSEKKELEEQSKRLWKELVNLPQGSIILKISKSEVTGKEGEYNFQDIILGELSARNHFSVRKELSNEFKQREDIFDTDNFEIGKIGKPRDSEGGIVHWSSSGSENKRWFLSQESPLLNFRFEFDCSEFSSENMKAVTLNAPIRIIWKD